MVTVHERNILYYIITIFYCIIHQSVNSLYSCRMKQICTIIIFNKKHLFSQYMFVYHVVVSLFSLPGYTLFTLLPELRGNQYTSILVYQYTSILVYQFPRSSGNNVKRVYPGRLKSDTTTWYTNIYCENRCFLLNIIIVQICFILQLYRLFTD